MQVLEKHIDREFVKGVKQLGGIAIKLSMMGHMGSGGWPDRMVLLPGGRICFVELKRPGKEPTPLQTKRIDELISLGFAAAWFDDASRALDFVRAVLRA